MLPYRYIRSLILLYLTALCPAFSQDHTNGIDSLFGYDPILYNGRQYGYQPPANASGNQYLNPGGFEQGSIAVRGRDYTDLALNYDLLNQVLLLKYRNRSGATQILEIPDAWLQGARIGSVRLEPDRMKDGKRILCQVIGHDPVKVKYFRRKDVKLDNVSGSPVYVFSESPREQSVVLNGHESVYGNNKSFIRAFDPSVQVAIGKFIKSNKLRVNKATDSDMTRLIEFCASQVSP